MRDTVPDAVPDPGQRLADHTTLRLGGPARRWVRAGTEDELVGAVSAADAADEPVLVLGGGSNLVVADDGFSGTVVEVATRGVAPDVDPAGEPTCGGVEVEVAAGELWDPFVARAVAGGWVGIEALSGIPGSVGATPIQNVGAYGQEVAQTIARVRAYDRVERAVRTVAAADCGFAYRWSRFKADPGRWVVLAVTFQLEVGDLARPVRYAELARALGVDLGARVPLAAVRDQVLALRRAKGMVADEHSAADRDTWSAGSFFTNPVLPVADLPEGAPAWPVDDDEGQVKTSAAWLIERAGFSRGFGLDRGGRVSLSTKHTLALTHRGDGRTDDLLALAREVRDGVRARFGVDLVPEPVLVGCAL